MDAQPVQPYTLTCTYSPRIRTHSYSYQPLIHTQHPLSLTPNIFPLSLTPNLPSFIPFAPRTSFLPSQSLNYNTPDYLLMQTLIQGGQGLGLGLGQGPSSSSLPNSTKNNNKQSSGAGAGNSPGHAANIPPALRGGLIPLELVKLYRVHAPLYPTPSSPTTTTRSSNRNTQGVTMRVFTVLRPDQLAQVSLSQHNTTHHNTTHHTTPQHNTTLHPHRRTPFHIMTYYDTS